MLSLFISISFYEYCEWFSFLRVSCSYRLHCDYPLYVFLYKYDYCLHLLLQTLPYVDALLLWIRTFADESDNFYQIRSDPVFPLS